jgi:hypothetical protein
MHRPRQAILSFLGCLLLGICGCSVNAPEAALVRSIYVEESSGAPTPDLAQYADIIHDTSVRVLTDRGYVAAMEPAHADAILHAGWIARPAIAGTPQGRVTLRLTLVSRSGAVLFAADALADMPVGFLSKEQIAELIRTKLGSL